MAKRLNDVTIRFAGEAGQGVESGGHGFATALSHGGLWLHAFPEYMSRIRGGLNFFQIRVSDRPLWTHTEGTHLLLAFSSEAVTEYGPHILPGGALVFDEGLKFDADAVSTRGTQLYSMPLHKIAQEIGGNKIMTNTAGLGAVAGIIEYPFEFIAGEIRENFARKGDAVVQGNLKVAEEGYRLGRERYAGSFDWKVSPLDSRPARVLIHGNQAFGMGAIAAGCRFMSGYPMTPASSILEFMAAYQDAYDIVIKQTEDEIAAVCFAIGAGNVGARALTATSGGGFSLMVEALGLAGMAEVPVVIVEAQRPGPSTGMPTKTEQGDLLFALFASQGEFPRIVLTPGTQEECFHAAVRAFNLAEKWQCPVIVMTEFYLTTALRPLLPSDLPIEHVTIDRGELLTAEQLDGLEGPYLRYRDTPSGISPRALPGHPKAVHQACSDEHDEYGHFEDEDAANRLRMAGKRMRKFRNIVEDLGGPTIYGPEGADLTLMGWGSSYGAMREAVDRLNAGGTRANLLHFVDVWPFPEAKAAPLIEAARTLVAVEGNQTGQFAHLVRAMTGRRADHFVLRWDGRPLSADYILANLKEAKVHA
ncbi:MAG TPA: 2-oxoacid:acceptor oxidoreductase subunit alpha [bacterium]|nr:2-oxoacid:acceptor oxidoreductase subunit alpha [bacterium]